MPQPDDNWSADQPPPWTQPYAGAPRPTELPPPVGAPVPSQPAPSHPAPTHSAPAAGPARPAGPSMGLGAMLAYTVSWIRWAPGTILGLAAVLSAVSAVLQATAAIVGPSGVVDPAAVSSGDTSALIGALVGTTPVEIAATVLSTAASLAVQAVATGAFAVLMGCALSGIALGRAEAWRRARHRAWALIGVSLACIAVSLAPLVVPAALVAWALPTELGAALAVVLAMAGAVAAVWLTVSLVLAPPALVLERTSIVDAMRRSFALSGGGRLRLLGYVILVQAIGLAVSLVASIPASAVALALGDTTAATVVTVLITSFVAGIVVLPFTAGMITLMYVDRRTMREGSRPSFW